MKRRLVAVLAAAVLGGIGIAALTRPAVAATAQITISGFAYHGDLHVQPGQTVRVVNNDGTSHTLTDQRTHHWDTGAIAANGGSRTFTAPSTAGRYPFGCTFHPDMTGVLVVGNPPDSSALTTSRSVTIARGAAHKMSTKLTDTTTHHVLGGLHVVLQKRTNGVFGAVKTVLTNASGVAAVTVHPTVRTVYRWRFAGTARHTAATSGITTISMR